ncbi:EboA domain-containing protein [Aquiflexum sp. TKW24L]|uniref:EboA domain-containing protein n=1 Tax=Aquiflexum sp. TKW24L TaxID=2942212 RepID=UPI0020BF72A1|nr:EboA domain-containing protein [Aquiflexum sp. TKW24L]MCL6261370.1 EboA domain-containing protein [Aquiflexum sp. TKW24L]
MDKIIDLDKAKAFLFELLQQESDPKSIEWLLLQKEKIQNESSYLKFYMAFGQASRYFKKYLLQPSEIQKKEANTLLEGFRPDTWDQLQTARTYLLLHFEERDPTSWVTSLNKLFETGDMHEQQSLYAAIPLMPFQKEMKERAIEGLRTNISSIFDAIALNNPYPAENFEERAWNQMVIKAIFLLRPLYQIEGADERANPQLANILIDFAHERWAAGRKIMPELWRFVGPFINEENIKDIEVVLQTGDLLQEKAALLACSKSSFDKARNLLDENHVIKEAIETGGITWESIGKEFQETLPK